jgi:hypothetical protein
MDKQEFTKRILTVISDWSMNTALNIKTDPLIILVRSEIDAALAEIEKPECKTADVPSSDLHVALRIAVELIRTNREQWGDEECIKFNRISELALTEQVAPPRKTVPLEMLEGSANHGAIYRGWTKPVLDEIASHYGYTTTVPHKVPE